MAQEKYDVFISYSRKDYVDDNKNVIPGNVVSTIKDRLTAEGISYWFDEEGIYSGQNFVEKIVTNIEASRVFLFLSTANANASPWTCKEIASADEFNKLIIPVRIDRTPYNKKVLFRIADLNYIEYYVNPQKALDNMVDSIKTYLSQLQEEERRKQEEEERKREEERKKREEEARKEEEEKLKKSKEEERRRKEQEQLVKDIKLACKKLSNDENKLELDRNNLLISLEKVSDSEQKNELKNLIMGNNFLRKQYEEQKVELQRTNKENHTLKKQNDILQKEVQGYVGKKASPLKKIFFVITLVITAALFYAFFSALFLIRLYKTSQNDNTYAPVTPTIVTSSDTTTDELVCLGKEKDSVFGIETSVPIDCDSLYIRIDDTSNLHPVSFILMRATSGKDNYMGDAYEKVRKRTKDKGIRFASFHSLNTIIEQTLATGKVQAKNYIRHVGNLSSNELPPVLSIPSFKAENKNAVIERCKEWLTAIEEHYGVKPIIYVGEYDYDTYFKSLNWDNPYWVPTNKTDLSGLTFRKKLNAPMQLYYGKNVHEEWSKEDRISIFQGDYDEFSSFGKR